MLTIKELRKLEIEYVYQKSRIAHKLSKNSEYQTGIREGFRAIPRIFSTLNHPHVDICIIAMSEGMNRLFSMRNDQPF